MIKSLAVPEYNDEIVKKFTIAAVFWGIVGFCAGLFIALQMAFPGLILSLILHLEG